MASDLKPFFAPASVAVVGAAEFIEWSEFDHDVSFHNLRWIS